jgi:hypothetical protein
MVSSRIPSYKENGFDGMLQWFSEMSNLGFLFHPDDEPENIVYISSGVQLFSNAECKIINEIYRSMFSKFGDDVYEAAYPIFMKAINNKLDA